MSKQYGLILKKKPGEDASNRSNYEATRLKRESKMMIDKALEEDPNIFAYDEIYDEMKKDQSSADQSKDVTKKVEKKSKFIESLKSNAEQRKAAEERRQDRKIEKEREAEGDLFKDKEVFVTDAYRQKLMERKIYEEREKKEQELEDLMDATKQQEHGMTAFYRNFLNQKVGERVELNPKEKYLDKMTENLRKQFISRKEDDKPIDDRAEFKKSVKSSQSKRQRKSSSSSEEEGFVIQSLRKNKERSRQDERSERVKQKDELAKNESNKSIDKQDSKGEQEIVNDSKRQDEKELKKDDENEITTDDMKASDKNLNEDKVNEEPMVEPEQVRLSLREILTDLFQKSCVGSEFVEAQKRYFERKASC